MSDSVSKDGGDNRVDFTASPPPHVARNENATVKTDGMKSWAVPGEVPPVSPRGSAFVAGKRGPN